MMHFRYFYKYLKRRKYVEQSLQPDNPIVTILATRYARSRKNRANCGLQVKRMLSGPFGRSYKLIYLVVKHARFWE